MRVPTRRSEIMRQAEHKEDYYVTPDKIAAMRRDLERLTTVERGRAAEEVHRTKQMGDLSENAGYQEAKAYLRRVNDRITSLDARLKMAIPIEAGPDKSGRVRIGSTVTVHVAGKLLTFQILGSQETSPGKGRISHLSPLGSALLGHKVGESVVLRSPSGSIDYTIIEIA